MNHEIQQHIAKQKRIKEAKDAMLALINSTNVMGGDADVIQGMTEALQYSHRTLQQSFISCFVGTMVNYAEFRTDARNENAVQFAKDVSKMDNIHFPFV